MARIREALKPALATRSKLWVAYALLAVAVCSPAGFVVWLVREAVENERFMVEQLWREAEVRALEDARRVLLDGLEKRTLEAIERGGLAGALEGGLADGLVWLGERPRRPDGIYDTSEARELLAEGRRLMDAGLEESEAALIGLFDDAGRRRVYFEDGRHALGMLARLLLDETDLSGEMLERIEALATDYAAVEFPVGQRLNLLEAMEGRGGELVRRLAAAERLGWRWRREIGTPEQLGSIWANEAVVASIDVERGVALLFEMEGFVELAGRLAQAGDERWRVIVGLGGEGEGALRAALDEGSGLLEVRLEEAGQGAWESAGRGYVFVLIGVVVFGLSAVSGLAIYLFLRRQNAVTQLKNDLVATVTHELKTPVSSIRLLVDTLLDEEAKGQADTREYLELIGRENRRLGHLIDNFLSFSRMERAKASFALAALDPAEVARGAEQAFRERFKDREFDLETSIETDERRVLGDRDALESAVGNLLENAFKYGCSERRIRLRAAAGKDGASFEVEDFGRGVARKEQRKIFGKFYQSSHGRTEEAGGVGLGLSIVAFIVAQHSGTVELRSELGYGSVFKITIPYAKNTDS